RDRGPHRLLVQPRRLTADHGGVGVVLLSDALGACDRATAFDQQVALSLGIPVKRALALAWALSAMVSAIAGMVAGVVNGVSSGLSFFGIKVFPAVMLGGLDSLVGAIIGGLTIGVLENLAQWLDAEWLGFGNL